MLNGSRTKFNSCGNARYMDSIDRERRNRSTIGTSACPNISVVQGNTMLNDNINVDDVGTARGLDIYLPVQSSSYELDLETDDAGVTFTIDDIFFGRQYSNSDDSVGFGACNNFLYTLRINNTADEAFDVSINMTHDDDKPSWLFPESGNLSVPVRPGNYAMLLVKAELRGGIPHHTIMSFTEYTE